MEAIIRAAPPTTAYNKTALLDSYQAGLQQTAVSFPLPTQAPATAPAEGASVIAPGGRHLLQYAGIATPRTVFDRDTYMVSPHCEVGRRLMWLASDSLQVTSVLHQASSITSVQLQCLAHTRCRLAAITQHRTCESSEHLLRHAESGRRARMCGQEGLHVLRTHMHSACKGSRCSGGT